MAIARDFGPLDVTDFTVGAMLRAGIAIRRAVRGADSLEAAAELMTRYLYEHCAKFIFPYYFRRNANGSEHFNTRREE